MLELDKKLGYRHMPYYDTKETPNHIIKDKLIFNLNIPFITHYFVDKKSC